jgi:hypothetical protein
MNRPKNVRELASSPQPSPPLEEEREMLPMNLRRRDPHPPSPEPKHEFISGIISAFSTRSRRGRNRLDVILC